MTRPIGVGHAPGHHGELLQGVFTHGAEVLPALVTLAGPALGSRAVYRPDPLPAPHPVVRVLPTRCSRAAEAARRTLTLLSEIGVRAHGGLLRVHPCLPVGAGMGSSSADVVASVRAVAAAHGVALAPEEICRIAASCEGACDPLAHLPRVVLFAQRTGQVLHELGAPPRLAVLSCTTGGGEAVETGACPLPDPGLAPTYDRLRRDLVAAMAGGDLDGLGQVATASARLNQERLERPELELLERCCRRHGGLGVQVAHSGCVAGVLFDADPGCWSTTREQASRCAGALHDAGIPVRGLLTPRATSAA